MSNYYVQLDPISQRRYKEKLALMDMKEEEDPYDPRNDKDFVDDMKSWPPIEYPHIFFYFIERPGVYTRCQLQNWKSLEAYNYFISGHVRVIKIKKLPKCCVLLAQVNPSQSSPDKAHSAWVGIKHDGTIITCHCTCMAGLGEGCSHSAAILFKVEYAVRNGYTASTSSLCGWNQVYSSKHQPDRIFNIKFAKPKRERSSDHDEADRLSLQPTAKKPPPVNITEPSESEQHMFLNSLSVLVPKAAVLSATFENKDSEDYGIPASLPPTIMSLYKPCYKNLSKQALQEECLRIFNDELAVTPSESHYLFMSTRLQSQSSLWHLHRKGRLTASSFGAICKTSIEKPSKSLVKKILGVGPSIKTAAMRWGCDHEHTALEVYKQQMEDKHTKFEIDSSGLFVNPIAPHLGASPDGFVSCTCCGLGVIEIKCPHSIRDTDPTRAAFFENNGAGGVRLSQKDNYYYQVQGQMLISERMYCDFVCWTSVGIHIERIPYNDEMASEMVLKLDNIFVEVILPGVLCGTISEPKSHCEDIFCICRKGESGKMIYCDSPQCEIGWYHYSCLGLDNDFEPDEWFCPQCEKDRQHIET